MATTEALQSLRAQVQKLEDAQELSMGVCLIGGGDSATLRPVLSSKGLSWRCDHEIEHWTEIVAKVAARADK
jgi:hypothetical protein